jgi:hypothetical protein
MVYIKCSLYIFNSSFLKPSQAAEEPAEKADEPMEH